MLLVNKGLKNFGAESHLPKSKGAAAFVAFGIACSMEFSCSTSRFMGSHKRVISPLVGVIHQVFFITYNSTENYPRATK